MKIITPWQHGLKFKGETNTSLSLTVPDQSMTIPEIMARHRRGLPIGDFASIKVPIYEDRDESMPDLSKMDLTERMITIKHLHTEFSELKQKIEDDRKLDEAQKTARSEKEQKMLDEWRAAGSPEDWKPSRKQSTKQSTKQSNTPDNEAE